MTQINFLINTLRDLESTCSEWAIVTKGYLFFICDVKAQRISVATQTALDQKNLDPRLGSRVPTWLCINLLYDFRLVSVSVPHV